MSKRPGYDKRKAAAIAKKSEEAKKAADKAAAGNSDSAGKPSVRQDAVEEARKAEEAKQKAAEEAKQKAAEEAKQKAAEKAPAVDTSGYAGESVVVKENTDKNSVAIDFYRENKLYIPSGQQLSGSGATPAQTTAAANPVKPSAGNTTLLESTLGDGSSFTNTNPSIPFNPTAAPAPIPALAPVPIPALAPVPIPALAPVPIPALAPAPAAGNPAAPVVEKQDPAMEKSTSLKATPAEYLNNLINNYIHGQQNPDIKYYFEIAEKFNEFAMDGIAGKEAVQFFNEELKKGTDRFKITDKNATDSKSIFDKLASSFNKLAETNMDIALKHASIVIKFLARGANKISMSENDKGKIAKKLDNFINKALDSKEFSAMNIDEKKKFIDVIKTNINDFLTLENPDSKNETALHKLAGMFGEIAAQDANLAKELIDVLNKKSEILSQKNSNGESILIKLSSSFNKLAETNMDKALEHASGVIKLLVNEFQNNDSLFDKAYSLLGYGNSNNDKISKEISSFIKKALNSNEFKAKEFIDYLNNESAREDSNPIFKGIIKNALTEKLFSSVIEKLKNASFANDSNSINDLKNISDNIQYISEEFLKAGDGINNTALHQLASKFGDIAAQNPELAESVVRLLENAFDQYPKIFNLKMAMGNESIFDKLASSLNELAEKDMGKALEHTSIVIKFLVRALNDNSTSGYDKNKITNKLSDIIKKLLNSNEFNESINDGKAKEFLDYLNKESASKTSNNAFKKIVKNALTEKSFSSVVEALEKNNLKNYPSLKNDLKNVSDNIKYIISEGFLKAGDGMLFKLAGKFSDIAANNDAELTELTIQLFEKTYKQYPEIFKDDTTIPDELASSLNKLAANDELTAVKYGGTVIKFLKQVSGNSQIFLKLPNLLHHPSENVIKVLLKEVIASYENGEYTNTYYSSKEMLYKKTAKFIDIVEYIKHTKFISHHADPSLQSHEKAIDVLGKIENLYNTTHNNKFADITLENKAQFFQDVIEACYKHKHNDFTESSQHGAEYHELMKVYEKEQNLYGSGSDKSTQSSPVFMNNDDNTTLKLLHEIEDAIETIDS